MIRCRMHDPGGRTTGWMQANGRRDPGPRRSPAAWHQAGGFVGESDQEEREDAVGESGLSLSCRPVPPLIRAAHELQEGLALELADALAGQAEVLADLAEGHRPDGSRPNRIRMTRRLAVVELLEAVEDPLQVVGLDQQVVGGLAPLVGQDVVQRDPVVLGALGVGRQVVDLDRLGDDADLLLREPQRLADLLGRRRPGPAARSGPLVARFHLASRLTM